MCIKKNRASYTAYPININEFQIFLRISFSKYSSLVIGLNRLTVGLTGNNSDYFNTANAAS